MDFNILVGGAAGQGIDTVGKVLEQIIKKLGFEVFSYKDYMSRVRGGHNFHQIRFADRPLYSHREDIDVILALDSATVELHSSQLSPGGVLVSDESNSGSLSKGEAFWLPLKGKAIEAGNIVTEGIVAVGAILRLFDLDLAKIWPVLRSLLKEEIFEMNRRALEYGYNLTQSRFKLEFPETQPRIMVTGNQAIGLGALAAGVSFYSGYPMTPSTGIMTYLAGKMEEAGIVVEQAEDEIAAINMAIGASYAGARAMTATSGGGFCLMVEGLGLAAMTETPLVIANIQRPGPATGFPTRTEQGDLSFVLTASHGEFPRMIIALRDPEDAFYQTVRAFNIADKFQIPVILLGDQYLGDYYQTIPPFDFSTLTIERALAGKEVWQQQELYERYKLTEDGVSPRLVPGRCGSQVVIADSDEHTETGHITEAAEVRIAMTQTRLQRWENLRKEVREPWLIGQAKPEILLVAWGSSAGPVREAIKLLEADYSVGALIFGDIYPLPTMLLKELHPDVKIMINVEQNATGQLAALIRQEAQLVCQDSILRYDGRPMSGRYISAKVKEVMANV
ncbi:2-oxoacid:acceptor oxidoreductase, alpha subunit [Desulfosporosinus acidiphilus SJ4]|uniref:2-oxoacid:acceptor oxidoreductase, alpha subunit n=1 Tax=Desulfosporosinus acidiphilus (strain DSM 22704 / JCM 16185 / SJ4) TaxID=646529 RepID=I4D1N2_DESAJ|nr:2-oxoacid:acceptor oxidoreductase subunit alpha [Desulfosporosinus acidiphilus]AFM39706.1 2-oxoacid:acceptor oxidoreductase, alpha subunit [Desulfosporosinus acidiphilus SJ4]